MAENTTGDCTNLPGCGFVKKHCQSKSLAVQGFINIYCKGAKQNDCKRKAYKKEHNAPPPDDLMPSGQMMAPAAEK